MIDFYLDPLKCTYNVSMKQIMDCFDDIQIEESNGFDFIEKDLTELIEESNDFNLNEYLNSNYDY